MRFFVRWALSAACVLFSSACPSSDASDRGVHSQQRSQGERDSDGQDGSAPAPDFTCESFPLLGWAAHTLYYEYFDRDRFDGRRQFLTALTRLGMHSPEFFAEPTTDRKYVVVHVRSEQRSFALYDLDSLENATHRLEEVLIYAQSVLQLEPEPLHGLEYAAINGMVASLDPHTVLLTPEEHTDLGVRTKGVFGGVGAQIRAQGRRIVIIRVLPNMPAEAAGVQGGDVIMEIAGQATVNMTSSEAQSLLRGPIGTPIQIKVRRNKKLLGFEIERASIRISSVTATALPGGVTYLRITNFQEDTADKVREALALAVEQGRTVGVVFDLRGNAGGLLVKATEIIDQLVPKGELVIVRSVFGREVDEAHEEMILPPQTGVVVVVDQDSASAAEIVSGGLKELGRAVVVGRVSFGKGTVQVVRPAKPYGRELALKLTMAEYLVAGDNRIQARGVVPALELRPVEPTAIAGVVRYYDAERFERSRERSRMAHHPSAEHEFVDAGTRQSPVAAISYLAVPELPPGFAEEFASGAGPDGERPAIPDIMRDPEIRVAVAVAVAVHGTSPKERPAVLKALADKIGKREHGRIAAALGRAGVDWSHEVEPSPVGGLKVAVELLSQQPIPAGEPFKLRVRVTNTAETDAFGVHTITDCVHDELDGIELMIGKIAAGETVQRDLQLHVMPWHSDFRDKIDVHVHRWEPQERPLATDAVMFEIAGAPKPALSYDVWVIDDPDLAKKAPKRPPSETIPGQPKFAVSGNGDGVLNPGEQVLLAFSASNDGPGKSPDVRALLRNLSGRQGLIEEGLVPLGPLKVGRSAQGAFGITVNSKAQDALPFELDLVVGDATLRVSAQHKLRFAVQADPSSFVAKAHSYRVRPGESVMLRSGADSRAQVVAVAPAGAGLVVIGKLGPWRVLAHRDSSRRLFLAPDAAVESDPTVPRTDWAKVTWTRGVRPPAIELEDYPRQTDATSVTVRGRIRHPTGVRDVVVMVRPPGAAQYDSKIHYRAAPDGATQMDFSVDVPLERGGNRVVVLARDGAKVQQRRDIWIFREG